MQGGSRWRTASLLGLGLALVGCSAPEPPPAAPPAAAPATRALVGWSGALCAATASVDGFREKGNSAEALMRQGNPMMAGYAAIGYLDQIARDVGAASKNLKAVAKSGVAAADAFTDELVKTLDGTVTRLPALGDPALASGSDEQKVAKAKQASAEIDAIEPQVPRLAALAGATPGLIASYNLAPPCAPVRRPDQPSASEPTRAMVGWSDGMCAGTKTLAALRKDPPDSAATGDPRFADLARSQLSGYLSTAGVLVSQVVDQLDPLAPLGLKAADDHRASILAAARAATAKLPPPGPGRFGDLDSLPNDQLEAKATQIHAVLVTVKPAGPDLPGVVRGEPALAAAYDLAPRCEPLAPVPSR
ncbi:hypothetical protein [Amycolatopsis sp. CA-230715]|uniref:hypothetical protein n=1 Tax=Amycolatopsis sp. CA-230715 TaxID=2745196 RepID=UPI001C009854|nr:hypothetical protein [Amycolatopsis sp. CA-230715]QWF77090.1 hypothetical protein HUW46_00470 [Amycolatopsis sp. CA-230715]